MPEDKKVLAVYDFASKQEYIYRTPKIKEISGASDILKGIYKQFAEWLAAEGVSVLKAADFTADFTEDAQILYEGGGTLTVLFRDKDTYSRANKIISRRLLTEYPGLSPVTACAEYTGDFTADRTKLFGEAMTRFKNLSPAYDLPAVTPFTQIDPLTFLPIVYKGKRYTAEAESFSADRVAKQEAFIASKVPDDLNEGKIAVIHIDGNSMGKKVKALGGKSYAESVKHLREFSRKVNTVFVEDTQTAIKSALGEGAPFRFVIAGGDDLTVICRAEDALKVTYAYFDSLCASGSVMPDKVKFDGDPNNTACAGIVVAHAKTPFALLYDLAEEACESAKERAHTENGNYLDFHYCHEGVTADLETLREQEKTPSARPYSVTEWETLTDKYAPVLRAAGRANVKALLNAAQESESAFAFEVERVNAYLATQKKTDERLTADPNTMNTVCDMAEFYDLWFAKKGGKKE